MSLLSQKMTDVPVIAIKPELTRNGIATKTKVFQLFGVDVEYLENSIK